MNKPSKITQTQTTVSTYNKINTICLTIIASVSIILALIYTRSILVPLVISVFIFTMITPLIRYIKYFTRWPKWLCVLIATTVVLVPLVLVIIFIANSISNFAQEALTYRVKLLEALNHFTAFLKNLQIPVPEELLNFTSIREVLSVPHYGKFLKGVGASAMTFISYSFLIFIFLFFMLLGSGRTKITNDLLKEIQNKVSAYLYIHIVMSVITGICVWIVYVSCGLDLAIMFAALTVLLNFIPNLGSVLAVIIPIPIAYLQFGWGIKFVMILLLPSIIQFVLGSLVEPKILGEGVDLHPVTVIGSLVFWGLVWGIPGAFMAVPMTAALRIVLAKLEPTRPFAELLSGRLPK